MSILLNTTLTENGSTDPKPINDGGVFISLGDYASGDTIGTDNGSNFGGGTAYIEFSEDGTRWNRDTTSYTGMDAINVEPKGGQTQFRVTLEGATSPNINIKAWN